MSTVQTDSTSEQGSEHLARLLRQTSVERLALVPTERHRAPNSWVFVGAGREDISPGAKRDPAKAAERLRQSNENKPGHDLDKAPNSPKDLYGSHTLEFQWRRVKKVFHHRLFHRGLHRRPKDYGRRESEEKIESPPVPDAYIPQLYYRYKTGSVLPYRRGRWETTVRYAPTYIARTSEDGISRTAQDHDEETDRVLSDEGKDHLTPFSDVSPTSQTTDTSPSSDAESTYSDFETPLTSPCPSPIKAWPSPRSLATIFLAEGGLDGGDDQARTDLDGADLECKDNHEVVEADVADAAPADQKSSSHPCNAVESLLDDEQVWLSDVGSSSERRRPKINSPRADTDDSRLADSDEAMTVTTPPTKVISMPTLFNSPSILPSRFNASLLLTQRRSRTHLQHHERSVSSRQRQFIGLTLQSPDRFIADRASKPTKEALLVRQLPAPKTGSQDGTRQHNEASDPFGQTPSRSTRASARFATLRWPLASDRRPRRAEGLVPDAVWTNRRTASAGAVWTVGGMVVTEGIASVTNGRGGRVTSGTNAPHYTSDFLQRQSPSEEELQHGQRLAIAMGIDPSARILNHSSPSRSRTGNPASERYWSDSSRPRTVWKNDAWEKNGSATHTKAPKSKPKDVPIIPFRVLDAPALRDDYYCSLLAYSPTLKCLAVGLGPHVYLWSESRGSRPTHIPDSLTAPFGAHVTSVSFSSREGGKSILAIGRADGRITLWSPQDFDPRFSSEQPVAISCVCFRPNPVKRQSIRDPLIAVATEELLVGDEAGNVYYYCIEWPCPDQRDLFGWHGSMTLLAKFSCHTQQVCGIAWSREGEFIATGGNDNQLYLFETRKLLARSRNENVEPPSAVHVRNRSTSGNDAILGQGGVAAIGPESKKQYFTLNAAVKAISFAPWKTSLVAAGGGSNDRCIHFFHALSGATLATIDCHAQVTSLVWSEKRKEIAATFGFAQPEHPYRVAVFSWPSCHRVVGIPWWGEERALYAVPYPGGPSGRAAERRRTPDHHHLHHHSSLETESRGWHGRRTREEGCLVIATSDASIKFHEIWPDQSTLARTAHCDGLLGGSTILEDGVSCDLERLATVR